MKISLQKKEEVVCTEQVKSLKQLTERVYITLLFFLILPSDKAEPNLGQYNWEAAEPDIFTRVLLS